MEEEATDSSRAGAVGALATLGSFVSNRSEKKTRSSGKD
jgi:hypothetical protein